MKTITDAVNELKGELRGGVSYVICYNERDIAYWYDDTPITMLGRCWRIVCTNAEFNTHVKELTGCPIKLKQWQDSKMNKPVYTKAMQDAGELPRIGELVQIGKKDGSYTDFFNGKLVHVKYKKLWISDDKHGDRIVNFGDVIFQPIDTRTDKEKAIDELIKESKVKCNEHSKRRCFSDAYDKWVK